MISFLLDVNNPVIEKYGFILQTVIWAIFNTSFQFKIEEYIPGKAILGGLIVVGVFFNLYFQVQILTLMNIMNEPRSKCFEISNQLDAYMQKKQFPIHLQNRLKFFFKKKFRRFYYREDDIKGLLSGEVDVRGCS